MKEFLQFQFLNNTIQTYIEVFATIFIALIIKRIISKYLAVLLFRLFTKAGRIFHKQAFLELIVGPLETFIFFFIVIIALDKLHLPAFLNFTIYRTNTRQVLDGIANTALIIAFIRLCLRLIKFFALILEEKNTTSDQSHSQLVVFFGDFFKVLLYITGILLILRFTFSFDITKLITGLSIVGAAIALAAKESLENFIASFIIFFDRPFITGDTVKVQGFTGTVEKIGLRSTRIRTDQKTYITVPNKQMVDTILDNVSMRTQRRAELKLEIDLSAGTEQLKEIIPGIKNILQKKHIENRTVFLSDTGKNAHIITVEYFTSMQQTLQEFNAQREEVNLEIMELLNNNNVDWAAASTDIVIKQKE
ncbi:MAG TPA: mechanosensitive ion channel family protein [Chitinophagaceae bacterium]|jgi:MscS family membrane protein